MSAARDCTSPACTARDVIDQAVTEADFQQLVLDLARLRGWRTYHTHDSRRSDPGFPDLVLARRGRVIFAELKSERGRVSLEQQDWLHELDPDRLRWPRVSHEVHLWRPSDWPLIEGTLR